MSELFPRLNVQAGTVSELSSEFAATSFGVSVDSADLTSSVFSDVDAHSAEGACSCGGVRYELARDSSRSDNWCAKLMRLLRNMFNCSSPRSISSSLSKHRVISSSIFR